MKLRVGFIFWILVWFAGMSWGQDVELIFSHQMHAEDVGAGCIDCHAPAETSTMPTDNLLPDMETCYVCHDEEMDCSACHKDVDNAVPYPRIETYIAKFPHDKHIAQDVSCETCHSGVAASSNIFDSHLPDMASCMNCHADMEQPDYCLVCHAENEDLAPADHRLDWTKAHGIASQTDGECSLCHTESQCEDCHQGDDLDHKVHPLNFRNNHGMYAKGNKDNCLTCHEEFMTCVDCHRQELVMPHNHASANWSNTSTGGRHAREAKLDLDYCISCHNAYDAEPICATCHYENN